jgi:nucleotide-binding universal stress UspA family protein
MQTQTSDPFTIVHPTDLTAEQQVPFAHAVALASTSQANLVALHATSPGELAAGDLQARPLLKGWGQDPDLSYEFVNHSCCEDPVDTALDALRRQNADLLVVGTHQRKGVERVLRESFSEAIALETGLPTLFVPIGEPGLVDMESGEIKLQRILIPAGGSVALQPAVDAAADFARRAGAKNVEFTLLCVGGDDFPGVVTRAGEGWEYKRVRRPGKPDEEIVKYCQDEGTDLVVMGTEGHSGVLDFLRGSRTERVIRRSSKPVLSVQLQR